MASKKKCADGGMAGGKMGKMMGKKSGSMPPWMGDKKGKKGKK